MNKSLVFGVGVPLLIVIVVLVLSSARIGLSETVTSVESIQKSLLYSDGGSGPNIPVLTFEVRNDFFLSRTHAFTHWKACPAKGGLVSTQGFGVAYGRPAQQSGESLDKEIFYGENYESYTLPLGAHSSKSVVLYVQPQYAGYFDKPADRIDTNNTQALPDHDSLLLIPIKQTDNSYSYYAGSDCNGESVANARYVIPIV